MPQPTNAGRGILSYLFGRDDQPFGDSWRDQWSQGVGNAAGILGFNPDRTASTTRRVIDFVPGVGDALSLNDAKRDYDAGNYGSAALNAGTGILGLVPGGGDAAAVAGKGLLHAIFAGVGAKTADKGLLAMAEKMAEHGINRDEIWNKTGWGKGADGKWRFEIDDSAAGLSDAARTGLDNANVGETAFHHNAYRTLNHPPLYDAYPDIRAMNTEITKGGGYPYQPSARYEVRESGAEKIFADVASEQQARELLSHELQHGIQRAEGFAGGGDAVNGSLAAYRDEIMREALAENAKGVPLGDALARIEAQKRWEIYNRSSGEVEARNVETRLNMTQEQRRATPPWATQDVPDELQIIRRR